MELTELSEYLDSPRLSLEIRGRKFVIEPASAKSWLQLQAFQAAMAKASESVDDPEAKVDTGIGVDDLARVTLGEAYEDVFAFASPAELARVGLVAFYWQLGNEDAALAAWQESGGKAQAPAASRSTSTTTAGASTTPRRTRTSGTSSRRKSPKA